MGATAWIYFVPHEPDVGAALARLRRDVFARGEYFKVDDRTPASIEQLLEANAESGTHSILDITHTAEFSELRAATPMTKRRLLKYFGTTVPTRSQATAFTRSDETPGEEVRRWQAVYFVVHDEAGMPMEYVFVGASGDRLPVISRKPWNDASGFDSRHFGAIAWPPGAWPWRRASGCGRR